MENVFIITAATVAMVCGLMFLSIGGFYGGSKASLCDAKVGDVFNFEYLQPLNGDPERYMAKVIEPVCHLDNNTISRMNARSNYRRHDASFKRTNHLVTCETADGNIRQFYCERAINCRRPLLANLWK